MEISGRFAMFSITAWNVKVIKEGGDDPVMLNSCRFYKRAGARSMQRCNDTKKQYAVLLIYSLAGCTSGFFRMYPSLG